MSESTVAKKLQIKPDYRVAVSGAPTGFKHTLGELPAGAKASFSLTGSNDVVILFAATGKEFEQSVSKATGSLKTGGILWIAYPKQSSKVDTDLNRDILRVKARAHGLKAVSLVAIDDTWSALRLKQA